jgi:hypothetical protein
MKQLPACEAGRDQLARREGPKKQRGSDAARKEHAEHLSACRTRTRTHPALHTSDAATCDRFLLAFTSSSCRSIGASAGAPQWSAERLDLAAW